MPLTAKGRKVRQAMRDKYGEHRGDQIFYASVNAKKVKGAHKKKAKKKRRRK